MNKLNIAVIGMCGALLSACASAPEGIEPAYVSDLQYRGLSCDQIQLEYVRVVQALHRAEEQQRQARSSDTVGVILLGLPIGSMTGQGVEGQVAGLKGQKDTLERVSIASNCTTLPAVYVESAPGSSDPIGS